MQYQVNITIDQQGLQQILSGGYRVGIARTVDSSPPSSASVVWVAFQPFQSNNVSWSNDGNSFYASQTPAQAGATISMMATTNANGSYTFANFVFTPAGSGNSVTNQSGSMQFGLAGRGNANGQSFNAPMNIVTLGTNQTGSFAPGARMMVFLVQSANNGTVLSQIPPDALTVQLPPGGGTINLKYNDQTGRFQQQ